jgi:hypothetical protein
MLQRKRDWRLRPLGNSGQLSIPADCPMPKPSLVDLYYSKELILAVPSGTKVDQHKLSEAVNTTKEAGGE